MLFPRTKIDVRRAARYFRINFMQISKLSRITAIDTNEARATMSCCLHVNCFERLLGKHGSILITIFPTSRRKERRRGEPNVLHKYWPKIFRRGLPGRSCHAAGWCADTTLIESAMLGPSAAADEPGKATKKTINVALGHRRLHALHAHPCPRL